MSVHDESQVPGGSVGVGTPPSGVSVAVGVPLAVGVAVAVAVGVYVPLAVGVGVATTTQAFSGEWAHNVLGRPPSGEKHCGTGVEAVQQPLPAAQ